MCTCAQGYLNPPHMVKSAHTTCLCDVCHMYVLCTHRVSLMCEHDVSLTHTQCVSDVNMMCAQYLRYVNVMYTVRIPSVHQVCALRVPHIIYYSDAKLWQKVEMMVGI